MFLHLVSFIIILWIVSTFGTIGDSRVWEYDRSISFFDDTVDAFRGLKRSNMIIAVSYVEWNFQATFVLHVVDLDIHMLRNENQNFLLPFLICRKIEAKKVYV